VIGEAPCGLLVGHRGGDDHVLAGLPVGGRGDLIGSMAEVTGESWRPEYDRAWAAAFELIAGVMIEGAAEAELDMAA
jgi:hypothetical protein